MKIDKEKLKAFASLPDDELWRQVTMIAGTHGISLPDSPPPSGELQKLRDAVDADKLKLTDALRVVNKYRKGK